MIEREGRRLYNPAWACARPMARVIQIELEDRIVDDLLFGDLARGGTVALGLDRKADRLRFETEGR